MEPFQTLQQQTVNPPRDDVPDWRTAAAVFVFEFLSKRRSVQRIVSSPDIDGSFPLNEFDLLELGEFVFILARHHQYKNSFVGLFLGYHRCLHHRFSVRVLGFCLPGYGLRLHVVITSHFCSVDTVINIHAYHFFGRGRNQ